MIFVEPTIEAEPAIDREVEPKTILVIDDDESQLVALQFRLERLGYQIVLAQTGEDALAKAFDLRPNLILLDLRLPDIGGFDVCAKLADSPETCSIPVIILSGVESPDIVRSARSAGCEYYVRKPYDPNVLLALIEKSLENHSDFPW